LHRVNHTPNDQQTREDPKDSEVDEGDSSERGKEKRARLKKGSESESKEGAEGTRKEQNPK
jgi:hypothetical protein